MQFESDDSHAMLLREAKELYHKIKSVSDRSGYNKSYKLNKFWANELMKKMLEIIDNSSSAIEAIHSILETRFFSVNTPDRVKEKAVDWHLSYLKEAGNDLFSMPSFVQESEFTLPDIMVERRGRKLTPYFLRTTNTALKIAKYCLSSNSRSHVLELGAGLGYLSRILRLFIPNCSYVIVDIPETLCFSYMFLKLNFPDAKVFYVTEEKQLKENCISEFDFIFIPTMFAEDVLHNKFDIFINTNSLGEMKNSIIQYWMDFIQKKLNVKYLYTLNRYLNTIIPGHHDYRLEENQCSVLYNANWIVLKWELEPFFTRCPYVDTVTSRTLEIIAERSSILDDERKTKSQQLLLDVMDEDWVRLERSFPSEMTHRDNILVNIMDMTGTLFKLWESIRLNTTESNVALMLKYLETLMHRKDREFEETFYYEDLFENLLTSQSREEFLDMQKVIQTKRQYRNNLLVQPYGSFDSMMRKELPIVYIVEQGYKEFNILMYKGRLYGLAQKLGCVGLSTVNGHTLEELQQNGTCVIGNSLEEVKQLIEQLHTNKIETRLVEEDYKGFNIISRGGKIYGLAQSEGCLDLDRVYTNDYRCVISKSIDEVKHLIDQLIMKEAKLS